MKAGMTIKSVQRGQSKGHTYKLFILFLIVANCSMAQVIPTARRCDWSNSGLSIPLPNPSLVLNIETFGGKGDGSIDNSVALISAISASNGHKAVIWFPPGNYLFGNTITLSDSIILRGASADSTILSFNLPSGDSHCIQSIRFQTAGFSSLKAAAMKDSSFLVLNSTDSMKVGDVIELRQQNGSWDTDPAAWATYCVGQITEVKAIWGDTLLLTSALRINYDTALHAEARSIKPISHVGIECLKIARIDQSTTAGGYNMNFQFARNCWVKGVESDHSIGAHVAVSESAHLEITGSYFHDAAAYDGGSTRGYGVCLLQHSSECLVENNVFKHLRHAMIVKQGANGNVFAYNYSIEPTRSEFPSDYGGDICLHGHYPFANLFEGNSAKNLAIDQAWGPNGPFNTFFRNRIELYGIIMSSGNVESDRQNFVGNEITSNSFLKGLYTLAGSGHFEYGNNKQGSVSPGGTNNLIDKTYYLKGYPDFWDVATLHPSIGIPNAIGSGTIPAKARQITSGRKLSVCAADSIVVINNLELEKKINSEISIYPNPFRGSIFIRWQEGCRKGTRLVLYDVTGRIVAEQKVASGLLNVEFALPVSLPGGIYWLQVADGSVSTMHRLIRQ